MFLPGLLPQYKFWTLNMLLSIALISTYKYNAFIEATFGSSFIVAIPANLPNLGV